MPKRVMIQCAVAVNRDAVRRETIDGVEHIIVTSFTMPDNIVMNGVLYPAEEIAASFHTLERTLAPVEHPTDANGNFISANDPTALHNFHAGAFNANVTRDGDRVRVEKHINVQQAQTSDRGKRLLDRVEELETNDKARPIHTSTGVWLELDELDAPSSEFNGIKTNEEFNAVARELVFDHDAILLDSVGAAQPGQGVGMAVNAQGEKCEVQRFLAAAEHLDAGGDELSHEEIREILFDAIRRPPMNGDWIVRVFNGSFIFEVGDELFSVAYIVTEGVAKITGIPLPVVREESFPLRSNQEGDEMKELILAALKAANIDTKDLDDDQLFAALNTLQANAAVAAAAADPAAGASTGEPTVAEQIAAAVEPITNALAALTGQLTANGDAEVAALAEQVATSGLYPNLDAESAKLLGVDKLKEMAANCATSFGVNGHMANNQSGSEDAAEMPE